MKRPVLSAVAAVSALTAASPLLAQTVRDYAAIYGVRSGASAPLQTQDVTTTVGTGPATRYAKPQPGAERAPAQPPRGYGFADYGRVSGGYPEYGDPSFPDGPQGPEGAEPAQLAQPAEAAQEQPAAEGQVPAQGQAQGEQQGQQEEAFAVSEGFFFDNYTSGTGFGVYGGEAVSSGQPPALILPSAGNRSQELGFPTGPAAGPQTPPPAPEDAGG